jgi:preprotein translocase subunit SecG
MVYGLLVALHVLVCIFLMIVVLLQSGKAADLAGAFGGMGSQTVFGPRGSATVLSKATTGAAIVFMLTSLTLALMATRSGAAPTLLDKTNRPTTSAPAPGTTQKSVKATVGTDPSGKGAKQVEIPIQGQPPAAPAGKQPDKK